MDDLIGAASSRPVLASDVERAVAATGLPPDQALDQLARRIAEGYVTGEYDFGVGDAAMNAIFAYAMATTNLELSRFSRGVYEAFDQGEFRGEDVTKCLIAKVLSRGYLVLGDCP